ncbi:hypothetical protein ACFLY6_03015, partial [Candidatus Dependentiae bacterium]
YLLLEVKRKEEAKKVYEETKQAFEGVKFTRAKNRMDEFLDKCIRGEKSNVGECLRFLDEDFNSVKGSDL